MQDNLFDGDKQRTPATTPAQTPRHPSHRQSLLLASNRRATMFFRTMDHTQPPEEDANNPPELNAQRRREYETIRGLNHMIETVIDNFEKGRENIRQFMQTVDQTEHLLDLWTTILSQAEHTQRLLDNPEWQGVNPPAEPAQPAKQEHHANALQKPTSADSSSTVATKSSHQSTTVRRRVIPSKRPATPSASASSRPTRIPNPATRSIIKRRKP